MNAPRAPAPASTAASGGLTHGRAVALMVLVTLLWSIAGVVTRQLDAARSFEVTFWRSAFNALTLAAILTVWRGSAFWCALRRAPPVLWLSAVCWATMFTAFMVALTLTTVANVLVTSAAGPLITALMTRYFLGHRLPRATWLAIAVAALGIGWMFGRAAGDGASWLGTLIALAVPLAGSANFTLLQAVRGRPATGRRGEADDGDEGGDLGPPALDMMPAVLLGATLSAAVTLPLAWPLGASAHDVGLLALLGAVQLALPCLLLVRASRALPAAEIALLALLEVVFGVTWAWLGAGETPSSDTVFGGALVLGALIGNELFALRLRRLAAA